LEHWDVELLTQVGAGRGLTFPSALLAVSAEQGNVMYWRSLQQQSRAHLLPCDTLPPLQSGGLPARFGGFLSATDLFDVALFGLSGGEAELMDAQQRLLLEASFEVGACKACMR
jgi:acyl transferase domain-containing protein